MRRPTKEELTADITAGMSWGEIAAKYGYTHPYSLVKLRKRYGTPFVNKRLRPSREAIVGDIESGLSWSEIADKYGYKDPRPLLKMREKWDLPYMLVSKKPGKEDLQRWISEGRKFKDIANDLGYSKSDVSIISKWAREYGLGDDFRPNHELRALDLTERQKEFVYGTLLGDGYIKPGKKSATLVMGHSTKQREYLEWKRSIMLPFVTRDQPDTIRSKTFGSTGIRYDTCSHPWFAQVRELCYPAGKKTVTREWLDKLTPLSVAVWFCDDGNASGSLATLCFTLEENELMQQWFAKTLGETPAIYHRTRNGKVRHYLFFGRYALDALRHYITPRVPDCMNHKLAGRPTVAGRSFLPTSAGPPAVQTISSSRRRYGRRGT